MDSGVFPSIVSNSPLPYCFPLYYYNSIALQQQSQVQHSATKCTKTLYVWTIRKPFKS